MGKKRTDAGSQGRLFQTKAIMMPEGYYSGDKPNPTLGAFVAQHLIERPYDAEHDHYDVPSFDRPIETTKATAIYNMHTYWSKKPHDAIRQYIQHYTKPGDLVLDPFCGSGGTALAALVDGRKAIAIDRSPAATFITKNYCTPVDPDRLRDAFEQVRRSVEAEIAWLYDTRCDGCRGKATTAYTVYSQVFQCPRCLEKVSLFDCVQAEGHTAAGKPKKISVCPHCDKRGHQEVIRSQSQKFGSVPVLVSYLCENGCKPMRRQRRHNDPDATKRKYFEKYDLGKLADIDAKPIPHWYPQGYSMKGFSRYQRDALFYYGVEEVADLFTKRNLWALATINDAINRVSQAEERDAIRFALESIILINSRMCDAENTQINKGTYYLPQVSKEIRPLSSVESKVDVICKAQAYLTLATNLLCISTQTSVDLSSILSDSIDYIFTDPPYAEKVQYGELNFVWEAWLGFDVRWHDQEIIVNGSRGRSEAEWAQMMEAAMTECLRVLKPGRWLSLCFHDTSEGTWELIQDIMSRVGFISDLAEDAVFIDAKQKSRNQQTADKVTKRDLVINFCKPKKVHVSGGGLGDEGDGDETFRDRALAIIRDYLTAHPGSTKDRIYDQVVSRLVRSGQMQSHNFELLLREVSEEARQPVKKDLFRNEDPDLFGTHEVARWYLRETESGAEESEQATADAAAERVRQFLVRQTQAELSRSDLRWDKLREQATDAKRKLAALKDDDPARERPRLRRELNQIEEQLERLSGQRAEWEHQALHYSQILEFYLPLSPKPKTTLFELLEDYFYQTDEGNWRPSADQDEAAAKARLRGQATRRRLKQLCRMLSDSEVIPETLRPDDATLAEWIRHCKRSGLYEAGKLLYERGGLNLDRLPEEVAANVEEDYQTCARLLGRGGDAPTKKGRKKKQ